MLPSSIRLRCRDFNFVTFNFADGKQAREAFEFIRNRTCRLGSIEKLYAFQYVSPRLERGINGWHLYDARAEFRRQGIGEKSPDKGWRISAINKDYTFSPTYPAPPGRAVQDLGSHPQVCWPVPVAVAHTCALVLPPRDAVHDHEELPALGRG